MKTKYQNFPHSSIDASHLKIWKNQLGSVRVTKLIPSKAFGIREANISNSIASSTKCSGMDANSIGQVDGRGILNPPTKPTNQTTINR